MTDAPELFPDLGFGLGLRPQHYPYIFEHQPKVDWFEILSENFMDTDGKPRRNLARVAERYPIVMHGVALSIGTVDPLNSEYLKKLKDLITWVRPAWVTDHLCWTGIAHRNTHDLLPLPYTEEALAHITQRIREVQDFLGRPLALENPSTYLEFKSSNIPEAEFIARMAQDSGCKLLLDVNNVYVSCYNHRLDPKAYIDALPLDRVVQIHLSGHSNYGTHIIDTHDDHVVDEVWSLYRYVVNKAGRVPNTMVEWDDEIPEFPVLFAEMNKAKEAAATATEYGTLPDLAKPQTPYVMNYPATVNDEQQRMQDAILLGDNIESEPAEWIRSKEQFSSADQLDVYINAYRSRLYDVTSEDYPVLQHYLGDEAFDGLITDFVKSARSDHFNIGRYAAKLPTFLSQHRLGSPFACDLIELENAISQLADRPETIALTPEHLAGLSPEALMESVLYPRQASQLFAFDYPVNDYFIAVKEETPLPDISAKKNYLIVFRHDDVVWRMGLEASEWRMLEKLFSGARVGDAIESLQAESKDGKKAISDELSRWFGRWIRNGLLAYVPADAKPKKAAA